MKKLIAALLLAALCLGLLLYNISLRQQETGGETDTTLPSSAATDPQPSQTTAAGQVRLLNSDPSRQAVWETLAAEYTRQTGVEVTVLSGEAAAVSADGQVPTLFTVDSGAELEQWQDLCLDLSGTDVYAQLSSWELTLQAEGKICGIAAEVEAWGLIYNCTLLAQMGRSRSDITGFSKLKEVAELISADDSLGFAAFASPDPEGAFAARLASVPGDIRDFWDLYTGSSPGTGNGLQEMLEGKAVFYFGSTAEYDALSVLGDHQIDIIPLYIGLENEERQGLCVTGTRYWCVRNDAPEQDIQAALDFLSYLVHPREDGTVPVDDLELLAPYRQAVYAGNALEKVLRTDLAAGKEYLVCPQPDHVPTALADALNTYAAAPTDENWAKVTALMKK